MLYGSIDRGEEYLVEGILDEEAELFKEKMLKKKGYKIESKRLYQEEEEECHVGENSSRRRKRRDS